MVIIGPRQLAFNFSIPTVRHRFIPFREHWLRTRYPLTPQRAALIAEIHFGVGVNQ